MWRHRGGTVKGVLLVRVMVQVDTMSLQSNELSGRGPGELSYDKRHQGNRIHCALKESWFSQARDQHMRMQQCEDESSPPPFPGCSVHLHTMILHNVPHGSCVQRSQDDRTCLIIDSPSFFFVSSSARWRGPIPTIWSLSLKNAQWAPSMKLVGHALP